MDTPHRRALFLCLAAVAAVYLPALSFGFVSWDDPVYVTQNPVLHGDGGAWGWLLTPTLGYPIPVTVASYRVEVALFGFSPGPMHAANVLLHLLSVGGVFAVGRRLGLGWLGAAVAAGLFGLHPAAAEPVSWVTGRKELLACLGCLGATYLALGQRRGPSTAAFALALLSKPVAAFLPAFDVLRRWRLAGEPLSASLRGAALSVAAVAVVIPLSWVGLQEVEAEKTHHSLVDVLREAWFALGHAVSVIAGLTPVCAVQQPDIVPPPFTPGVDGAPLVAAALLALAFICLRPARGPFLTGLLWALLAWLPASNLLPLTRYLADSYLYLPLVGIGWAAGSVAEAGWASRARIPVGVGLAAVAVLLAFGAQQSSARWQDSVTLWEHTIQQRPDDQRACRNAGNAYLERDDPAGALARYEACAERFGAEDFDKNIAITLCVLRRFDEALPMLERLAVERPGDATVRRYLRGVRKAMGFAPAP